MAQVEPRCADPNEGNFQWSTGARRVHFVDAVINMGSSELELLAVGLFM
jgi:hypothetical protein